MGATRDTRAMKNAKGAPKSARVKILAIFGVFGILREFTRHSKSPKSANTTPRKALKMRRMPKNCLWHTSEGFGYLRRNLAQGKRFTTPGLRLGGHPPSRVALRSRM